MSYLRKRTLAQQQNELKVLIEQRLKNEEGKIRQRVYQWLSDNQYFTDNELFDFYFCVAQNLAAVEVLGGSGEKILEAKTKLEKLAEVYTHQALDIANQINEQLENKLYGIRESQDKLDIKFNQVLEGLTREHENLKAISTGLVNSTATLLVKQKQLLVQTEVARKLALKSVIVAWIIPVVTLLGCMAVLLLSRR